MSTHSFKFDGNNIAMGPKKYLIHLIVNMLKSYPVSRRLKIVSELVNHQNHINSPCMKCEILKEYRRIRQTQ